MNGNLVTRVRLTTELSFIPAGRGKISFSNEVTLSKATPPGNPLYSGLVNHHITDTTVFCVLLFGYNLVGCCCFV